MQDTTQLYLSGPPHLPFIDVMSESSAIENEVERRRWCGGRKAIVGHGRLRAGWS